VSGHLRSSRPTAAQLLAAERAAHKRTKAELAEARRQATYEQERANEWDDTASAMRAESDAALAKLASVEADAAAMRLVLERQPHICTDDCAECADIRAAESGTAGRALGMRRQLIARLSRKRRAP